MAAHEGFFELRVAEKSLAFPASAQAWRQRPELPTAAIVVPSGLQASVPPGTRDQGATLLSAAPSGSGSALVRGDVPLSVESVEWNRVLISIVMHQPPGGAAHPVAAMVVDSAHWPAPRVQLAWLSLPDSARPAPGLDVARDEHLYTLAFRQAADASYCIPSNSGSCDGGQVLSQGEALQRVALHRECALAAQPPSVRVNAPRWRVVTISPQQALAGPKARVSVRLSDQDVALAGVQVLFSRLPHSACAATTQGDGTATCELADAQGHEGGHPEFDRAPVLVTFPGNVRGNPVLLPTTKLVATENGAVPSLRMR